MKYVKTLLVAVVSLLSAYTGTASAGSDYMETIKLYNYVTPLARDVTAPLELVGVPVIQNNGASCWARALFKKPLAKTMAPGYMGDFAIQHSSIRGCGYDNKFTLIFTYAASNDPSKTCTLQVTGGSYNNGGGGQYTEDSVRKEIEVRIVGSTGLPCAVSGSDKEGYTVGLGPVIVKK